MGELHDGPKHPLRGADPESYFDPHMVPPVCLPKGEGDCRYLAQHKQVHSRQVGLVRLPT